MEEKVLQIPKDLLEEYQISQSLLSSTGSDIAHLQSDFKGYVELTNKLIYKLVEKINKLEDGKKQT